jgi:phosphoglucosamine mutase
MPQPLDGLHVIVDCAHGAASVAAPEAYRRAGARVTSLAAEPDGLNINDGVGSTHIEQLTKYVVAEGADLGIAHDGDADRCLAVDADGEIVDGDQILAICALALQSGGQLRENTVVATVMSNLGLHLAMEKAGIHVVTTRRRPLRPGCAGRSGLSLGGEQSGHIVFMDAATTGDGLLTALRVMGCMASSGRPLAELASVVRRLPQILLNVPVTDKAAVAASAEVAAAVTAARTVLGNNGRILLSPSGTEELVRVMVEAPTQSQAEQVARRVADVVEAQ